jgi:hypothetical protein
LPESTVNVVIARSNAAKGRDTFFLAAIWIGALARNFRPIMERPLHAARSSSISFSLTTT